MSNVAHGAFALTPSESNFERLTKRLLALRAEIDAILAELAGQAMAMQRAEATAAPPAQELSPVLSDPLTGGESMREGHGMVEDAEAASEPSAGENATGEFLEPSAIVGFAAPEQPIADATAQEPVEVEQDTRDYTQQTSDNLTPIVAIDIEHADATSQCPEAEVSSTVDKSAATEAAAAEQPDDASILDAARHASAESTQLADTGISAADRAPISDSPADAGSRPCRGGSHQLPHAAKEAKRRACDQGPEASSLEPASGGKDRGVHPGAAYRSDHPGHGRPDRNGQRPVVPLDVADAVRRR